MRFDKIKQTSVVLVYLCLTMGLASSALAKTYTLRADRTTLTMPDGTTVPVWGFADDTAGPGTGVVTVPGPVLDLPAADANLTINLVNMLPVPVSINIPGLRVNPVPVRDNSDGKGLRVLSFSSQAPAAVNGVPGPPVSFVFVALKPGTYLYQSGTNPAAQVPMGLYGAVIIRPATAGQAYDSPDSAYANERVLLVSEIDKNLNAYVDANGTAVDPVNQINYSLSFAPQYYLVNGKTYPDTAAVTPPMTAPPATKTLLRLLNAGTQNHMPGIAGRYLKIIGEDGNFLNYSRDELTPVLSAGKTLDALLDLTAVPPTDSNFFVFYDRRTNRAVTDSQLGSMVAFLESFAPGASCSPFKGDLNGDGAITVVDVLMALNLVVNNGYDARADVMPLSANGLPCGNGTLDLTDALSLLKKAMGIN
jgi:FtsP/CotA-like multicopper oxidase with cupredoxin domain